jgi:predicted dehydrogenase
MKQVLLKNGIPEIEDVPSPSIEPGHIIVQSAYSCISTGTEIKGMSISSVPLWKRAVNDPKKAVNFIKKTTQLNLSKTVDLIQDKVSSFQAIGYSSSGVVIEVGEGVNDICIGDRVACAGSAGAYHAEQIKISRNLVVKVPENVSFKDASTVSLGAIALQGVRRLNPSIGESVAVIGLGIIGQITVQLLKASGCKVIAIDLDSERLNLASQNGANEILNPKHDDDISRTKLLTNGYGTDAVIITASSSSDEVISSAFNMCRKKAKVILVGDVGLNLKRDEFYAKELDFLISSSYGPGRYDNSYEEKNIDYPYPYVRWTENRNMEEFLNLIDCEAVNIKSLISSTYKVDNAKDAYKDIQNESLKPLLVLLDYDQSSKIDKVIFNNQIKTTTEDKINIAIVGVGSFCRAIHLPNINSMKSVFSISGVMNRSGHNALSVMKQYGGNFSTTNFHEILQDKKTDSVLISSRHNSHFNMTIDALKAGKNVLVEKPLTLNENDLEVLKKFYKQNKSKLMPLLMVAYNRRFSPFAELVKSIILNAKNPCLINYEMNAGYVDKDNWIYGEEGGGRNIGEACHIYDLFNYFIGGSYSSISVKKINSDNSYFVPSDNFQASINYKNGSIANLLYTSMGSSKYQKETMKIFVDGQTIVMNDYSELIIYGKDKKIYKNSQNKGHKEELISFSKGIKSNNWPISLSDIIQASKISFDVENLLNKDQI